MPAGSGWLPKAKGGEGGAGVTASRFWNPENSLEGHTDDGAPVRPAIVEKLCEVRGKATMRKPKEFDMFQLHVQENNMQLARFDFLQLETYYEGLQIGPSNPGVPKQGATALEMLFKYYAARRQADQIEGGSFMTFEDMAEANETMDMAELTKFMREFLPGVFNRREINWLFKMANQMEGGLSDESVATMDFGEFVGILCQVAMQLYRGSTPQEMAKRLGARLGLQDPIKMRATLKRMGRIDAGFGAWKSDEGSQIPAKFDPAVRFQLEPDAGKFCLSYHDFCLLKSKMLNSFPDVKIPEWKVFPGPFIAFVYPERGARQGHNMRFKLLIRNIAPRAIELFARLVDLPNVSMIESGEKGSIAPGMDKTLVITVETILPSCCQLGGLVFSAQESGPELFRCPIFLRATGVSHHAIGDFICSKIAADVDPQEMRTKFKAADQENSGRVSVDIFQKIVGDLGFDLNDTQKDELRNQTDFEKVIDQEAPDFGELSVDYDEFVHKISGLSKSSTRQADVTLPISPQRSGSGPSSPTSAGGRKAKSPGAKERERKKIGEPPRRAVDSMEKKTAESGFAVPLSLEHAVPMEELNAQLSEIMSMRRRSIVTPQGRNSLAPLDTPTSSARQTPSDLHYS